ncbi:MAG TPA: hypothetical protein V6D26_28775, partial [Stenomitos sp.]
YQGNWRWGRDIPVSSQLQAVLQKMLAHKPSDRFSGADEVLQALPSPPPLVTHSPISQKQTQVVALKTNPNTPSPNPTPPPRPFALNTIASYMRTLVVAPKAPAKPVPVTPSPPIATPPKPQPMAKPPQIFNWLGGWLLKMGVGAGLILVTGLAGWAVMSSMIRSVRLDSLGIPSENTPDLGSPNASEQKRMSQLLSRRQSLGIPDAYFNHLVNDVFYTKYPQVRGRTLTLKSEDATLRKAWHNTAEDLLDKLEQAQLSATARRQLGSYTQRNYQTWQRQAQRGQLGGYTMNQLSQQTDQTFNRLFPEQRSEKLNLQTFGQIWYAICSDRVSQLETGKK